MSGDIGPNYGSSGCAEKLEERRPRVAHLTTELVDEIRRQIDADWDALQQRASE
jgi:hypothetical protein